MSAPKLYGDERSPCVRAVLITAKAIDLNLEYVAVDLMKEEHLTDDFIKMNPQHTVPTLDDNGFILWDSQAIMIYLVEKYGEGSPLYPADLQKRAVINRLLFFHAGEIFASHLLICTNILFHGNKNIPEVPLERLKKSFGNLELFLGLSKYVAGDELTIADFSIWTTISNAQNWIPIEKDNYPNIAAWKENMESLPYAALNQEGAEIFREKVSSILNS